MIQLRVCGKRQGKMAGCVMKACLMEIAKSCDAINVADCFPILHHHLSQHQQLSFLAKLIK